MVRNSLNYVGWNKRKLVSADLKRLYTVATEADAEQHLTEFEVTWDDAYPPIAQSWRNNWARIIPSFDYPPEIRKIYINHRSPG
jgi:putative transposase